MGIESDQVVYDYLSRVGDLAQATPLTAAERARLVTGLRQAIDTKRAEAGGGNGGAVSQRAETTAVKKILKGIGTPDEVVRRAVTGGVPVPSTRREARVGASGGAQRGASARPGASATGPAIPGQSGAPQGTGDAAEWDRGFGGSARGGVPELGPSGAPSLIGATVGGLPGWQETFEPDFLNPDHVDPRAVGASGEEFEEAEEAAQAAPRRGVLARLLRGDEPPPEAADIGDGEEAEEESAPLRGPLPLVETLAALVLLAAAVLGLWYVALLGWFLAYTARRIGRTAAHAAGLWLPLLVAALCGFWFYSHVHGRPAGHQLTDAQFKAALRSAAALWLRAAAGCSAVFLAWRSSRARHLY